MTTDNSNPTHKCPRCQITYPKTSEFFYYRNKMNPNSLYAYCKKCSSEMAAERQKKRLATEKAQKPSLPTENNNEKQCYRCKRFYPRTNEFFHYNNKEKKTLNSYCKQCISEYERERSVAKKIEQGIPEELIALKFRSSTERQCSVCKKILPKTNEYFSYNNKAHTIFRSRCKVCDAAVKREKRNKKRE